MDASYALAAEDYRQLARSRDWAADLRGHAADGRVRLLDVACGSGRFPAALLAAGLPTEPVEAREPLAAYLAGCRAADGAYEFRHEVHLITWEQA